MAKKSEQAECPDCMKCGACCIFYAGSGETGYTGVGKPHVRMELLLKDVERLRARGVKLYRVTRGYRLLQQTPKMPWNTSDYVLPAIPLEGKPGLFVCALYRFNKNGVGGSCSEYDARPYHCRWFAAGDEDRNCVQCRLCTGVLPAEGKWLHYFVANVDRNPDVRRIASAFGVYTPSFRKKLLAYRRKQERETEKCPLLKDPLLEKEMVTDSSKHLCGGDPTLAISDK